MKHPWCSNLCKKLLPDHDGSTIWVCDSQREWARWDVPSPVRKLEAITPHANFRPRNNCHSNLLIGIIQQQLLWRQITVFKTTTLFIPFCCVSGSKYSLNEPFQQRGGKKQSIWVAKLRSGTQSFWKHATGSAWITQTPKALSIF